MRDCCHIQIAKEILNLHNGQIQPVICPSCHTEAKLPLEFSLDSTRKYFLVCQHCQQTLWQE